MVLGICLLVHFYMPIGCGKNYSWAADFANASAARVVSQFGPRIKVIEYISLKQQFNI